MFYLEKKRHMHSLSLLHINANKPWHPAAPIRKPRRQLHEYEPGVLTQTAWRPHRPGSSSAHSSTSAQTRKHATNEGHCRTYCITLPSYTLLSNKTCVTCASCSLRGKAHGAGAIDSDLHEAGWTTAGRAVPQGHLVSWTQGCEGGAGRICARGSCWW